MALKDKITDILLHINKYESNLEYNYRLYTAYEGQIKSQIEDSMRAEIVSPAALKRALQRIPSINILRKGVDKISTVYAEPVKRYADEDSDTEIMNNIVKLSRLDIAMMSADSMANLQKRSAIEPYVDSGVQKFRIYGAHQFLPYGDDRINPTKMTVFIKLMGMLQREVRIENQINPRTGVLERQAETVIKEVKIYLLYSDTEILLIDQSGEVLSRKQAEFGIPTVNEFGTIPQVYINKSSFELIPFPDTAGLDVAILIPKLLTDLNYAVQFMSHSIIWTKNVELGNQEINPDVVVDLGETGENGQDPAMGVITPEVDIQGVLQMVEFELNAHFSSMGIKTTGLNGLKSGREVSGIAKAMDEGDTTLVRRKNTEFFKEIEAILWEKMEVIQNKWSEMGLLKKETRKFSAKLGESFSIIYGEVKVIESVQDKVMKLDAQDRLSVITKKDIVKEFNPDFTKKQIDKRLSEVDAQKKLLMEEFNAAAATVNNDNDSDSLQQPDSERDSGDVDRQDNKQDS